MKQLNQSCLLITGIMASGKSSVAQCIAEKLPGSVHLRGDLFRRMIVNQRANMSTALSDEAMRQLRLRYQLSATVAQGYCQAGFTVVYQDVIIGSILNEVIAIHTEPLYVVVLCPSPDVAQARDATRHKHAYSPDGWTPDMMHAVLLEETPKVGLWVDSSDLTIEETADVILSQLDDAKIS